MPKRTWQPKVRKRLRTHGFRKRMQKPGGRNVIRRRRLKQRTNLTVQLDNSQAHTLERVPTSRGGSRSTLNAGRFETDEKRQTAGR